MKYKSRLVRTQAKQSRKQAILYLFLSILFVVGVIKVGVPAFIQLVSWWSGKDAPKQAVDLEIPPQAPVLSDTPEATFSTKVKLSGFAQAQMKIKLRLNSEDIDETQTQDDGSFTFENVNLEKGDNDLELISVNEKNKESQPTFFKITQDSVPVKIEITEPQNESQIVGANNQNVTIKGKIDDEDAEVRINENFVIVGFGGTFEYHTRLSEGLNELVVKVTDKAGNMSEQLLRLNFSL